MISFPPLLLLLLLLLVCGVVVYSNTVPLAAESEIAHVTIYTSSFALIERHIRLPPPRLLTALDPGLYTVSLPPLPEGMQQSSLRIIATNEERLQVLDFKVATVSAEPKNSPEYSHLMKSIREVAMRLNAQKHRLMLESDRLENKLASMQRYVDSFLSPPPPSTGSAPERLTFIQIQELLTSQDVFVTKLNDEWTGVRAKIEEVESKLGEVTTIQQRISTIVPEMRNKNKQVTCQIRVHESIDAVDAEALLSVKYLIEYASWDPVYDISIDNLFREENGQQRESSKRLVFKSDIDYFANVYQKTQEDWQNINITLSTSSPSYLPQQRLPDKKSATFVTSREYYSTHTHEAMRSMSYGGSVASNSATQEMMYTASAKVSGKGNLEDLKGEDEKELEEERDVFSSSSASGDLGLTYDYHINHLVNVSTIRQGLLFRDIQRMIPQTTEGEERQLLPSLETIQAYLTNINTVESHYKQLLLIEKLSFRSLLFTYCVPSLDQTAYLLSYTDYTTANRLQSNSKLTANGPVNSIDATLTKVKVSDNSVLPPLLESNGIRVRIQNTTVGSTSLRSVRGGEQIRLNLGADKNIHVEMSQQIPKFKNNQEDKSTWFVTDKKTYRMKYTEYRMSIKSTYSKQEVFVVLSENLPFSTEEDIKVELISPKKEDLQDIYKLKNEAAGMKDVSEGGAVEDQSYLQAILQYEWEKSESTSPTSTEVKTFFNKATNNILWAMWLKPQSEVQLTFKYQFVWPEGKVVSIS